MDIKSERLTQGLNGTIEIPPDKSISHRAAIFSMLTKGKNTVIKNYSKGVDCLSTLDIIRTLGCDVNFISEKDISVNAVNALSFNETKKLNCGNSGTAMRLMAGVLAGQNFNSVLFGDESLSSRPMKRIITPLSQMGAMIESENYKAPLKITGKKLVGIDYATDLSSAQVKSAVLLAGLNAEGTTIYRERAKSRNHTELMLKYLDADIEENGTTATLKTSKLTPKDINVCGDISSAAFFLVAAAIVPNSDIIIKNVGLNVTRTGILDVLKQMGADIEILNIDDSNSEPIGDVRVKYSSLTSTVIEGDMIPRLIDEIPIIALLATQAEGTTVIKDAQDLKNKETDRINAVSIELQKLGLEVQPTSDGFIIQGKQKIKGGATVESYKDHRIAMTLFVAGMIATNPVIIKDFDWVNISFPEFLSLTEKLKK